MCTVEQVVYVRPQTVQQTPVKLKQEMLTLNTHVFLFITLKVFCSRVQLIVSILCQQVRAFTEKLKPK